MRSHHNMVNFKAMRTETKVWEIWVGTKRRKYREVKFSQEFIHFVYICVVFCLFLNVYICAELQV